MSSDEIKAFTFKCENPFAATKGRTVSPEFCKSCPHKKNCPTIQELMNAEALYKRKFKGTLLESAMLRAGRLKKQVAMFILED